MHAPHATKGVLDLDIANLGLANSLDLLEQLTLLWDSLGQRLLEGWLA
jgi:hypothetical protein